MPKQRPIRVMGECRVCCFCHTRKSSGTLLRINPEAIRKVTYHEDHDDDDFDDEDAE